jgi:hypothetical protein
MRNFFARHRKPDTDTGWILLNVQSISGAEKKAMKMFGKQITIDSLVVIASANEHVAKEDMTVTTHSRKRGTTRWEHIIY